MYRKYQGEKAKLQYDSPDYFSNSQRDQNILRTENSEICMIMWHSLQDKSMRFKLRLFESKMFFFYMFSIGPSLNKC